MKKTIITLSLLALTSLASHAATVSYVFHTGAGMGAAGTAFDGLASSAFTSDGVQLTASAAGPGSGTVFNGTATSFGINAGDSGDDTDQFDNGAGGFEVMTFSFDKAGTFTSIDFASLTNNSITEAVLSFTGGGSYNINNANTDGSDLFVVNEAFAASQVITLSTSTDQNFALQEMTINAVPEPSSTALLGLGGLALIMRRRK